MHVTILSWSSGGASLHKLGGMRSMRKSSIIKIIEHDVEVKCPRVAGRQQHRSNTLAATPEAYYRVNLVIPGNTSSLSSFDLSLNDKFVGRRDASLATLLPGQEATTVP